MRLSAATLTAAAVLTAGLAHAEAPATMGPRAATPADDGAYGRLRGDVAFSLAAGLAYGRRAAPTIDFGALYLATAGAYASVAGPASEAAPWSPSAGVEVRPLFFPRFFKAYERGPAELDLILDSIALRIGARRDRSAARPALELALGIEIPLTGFYGGPFLGLRAAAQLTNDAQRGVREANAPPVFLMSLTLGWRAVVLTHAVDAGDVAN